MLSTRATSSSVTRPLYAPLLRQAGACGLDALHGVQDVHRQPHHAPLLRHAPRHRLRASGSTCTQRSAGQQRPVLK